MDIYIKNCAKYTVMLNFESYNIFIESNSLQTIKINGKSFIVNISMCKKNIENDKHILKSLSKVGDSLFLNISCRYEVDDIYDGLTIEITDEVFEFTDYAFLLPFGYYYAAMKNMNCPLRLAGCCPLNTKNVLRTYRALALLINGGYDFLLNIFSYILQISRIKKLCKTQKIYKTLNSIIKSENDL